LLLDLSQRHRSRSEREDEGKQCRAMDEHKNPPPPRTATSMHIPAHSLRLRVRPVAHLDVIQVPSAFSTRRPRPCRATARRLADMGRLGG
jgi:hypothetical protein